LDVSPPERTKTAQSAAGITGSATAAYFKNHPRKLMPAKQLSATSYQKMWNLIFRVM
jgi:hypothetical protein